MNIFKYLTQSLAANGGHLAPDLTPPLMQASGLDYEDHLCMYGMLYATVRLPPISVKTILLHPGLPGHKLVLNESFVSEYWLVSSINVIIVTHCSSIADTSTHG